MIRLIGILLILASSVLFGELYLSRCRAAVSGLTSLSDFLKYARERVKNLLEPLSSVAEGYSDGLLEESGFLPVLRSGGSLAEAFSESADKLSSSADTQVLIASALASLDMSSGEGLVSGLDALISSLGGIEKSLSDEAVRRGRAVRITAIAAGLGLAVLLL